MKPSRDYAGICAAILSLGIAASLVIASIAGAIRGHVLTPDEITLLSTITGAAIGAVATYMGTSRRAPEEHATDDEHRKDDEQ